MNDHQKQLVQDSFDRIVPIAEDAAALFYDRLFFLDPSLRPLFKGDMAQQGRKLMSALSLAVAGLDNLDQIVPALQHLGRSHVRYGVQNAHYAVVGEALIWTLGQALGERFTNEVRSAWQETYRLLSTTMRDATRQEIDAINKEAVR